MLNFFYKRKAIGEELSTASSHRLHPLSERRRQIQERIPADVPPTYYAELNRQCNAGVLSALLIAAIIWLPYLPLDAKLLSGNQTVYYLRLGLTVTAGLLLLLRLLPGLKERGLLIWTIAAAYGEIATGVITGISGMAPEYVAGYCLVLMLFVLAPFPLWVSYSMMAASLTVFIVSLFYSDRAGFATAESQYLIQVLGGTVLISTVFTYVIHSIRRKNYFDTVEIKKQQEVSRELLLNVLPADAASQLHKKGWVEAAGYENVTVGFADIVGFSRQTKDMDPGEVIRELDRMFQFLDHVMEKYNLEKIKTFGDSYLFSGGIPPGKENGRYPVMAVLAGLEIQDYMKRWKQQRNSVSHTAWELRLGIHYGPVLAGAVGDKKFSYDIWGETVNIASRIQATGDAGKVNISAAVCKMIEPFFELEETKLVRDTDQSDLETCAVKRIRLSLSEQSRGLEPSQKFWNEVGLKM